MELYLQRIAFLEWLQDNNIAENYFNNLSKDRGSILPFFDSRESFFDIISISFTWDETDEGYDYWSEKDDEWNEYLKKINTVNYASFVIRKYNIFQCIPINIIKKYLDDTRDRIKFMFGDLVYRIGVISENCYYLNNISGSCNAEVIDRLGISKSTLRFLFPKSSSTFVESFETDCKASPEFCTLESLCKYIGFLFQVADKEHGYSIPRKPFETLDLTKSYDCETSGIDRTIKLAFEKPDEASQSMKEIIESVIEETKDAAPHLKPKEPTVKEESFKLTIKPKKAVHIIL